MAINPIAHTPVPQDGSSGSRGTSGSGKAVDSIDARKRQEAESAPSSSRTSETVEISAEAVRLLEREALATELKAKVADAPDVRPDKVAEARARVEAGAYDTESIRNEVAQRLIDGPDEGDDL